VFRFLVARWFDDALARVAAAAAALTTFGSLAYAGAVPLHCEASVVHPLNVHVAALDPIAHGAEVRLRVSVQSLVDVDHTVVRLVSTGGAAVRGATFAEIGSLVAGHGASHDFVLDLPARGARHYIQFQVTAEGPAGRLTRGACYNVLPDGPLQSMRTIDAPDGRFRQVAARRLP